MSEEVTYTVSLPGTSKSITMFTDDTIETVRMRIGIAAGIHPDKMRIYVQSDLPADYYTKDSRRWEAVFLRMSPEGKPIGKPSLDLWAAHTDPTWTIEGVSDKTSWMMLENKRESSFTELRILGAPEDHSWIFPLNNLSDPPFSPAVSLLNVETRQLFGQIHPTKITGFRVILHENGMKPQTELLYYPFLRNGSPAEVPEEIARSILKQSDLVRSLLERKSPHPVQKSVLRIRWKIPLVNTDLGGAPRNRFEQIFYGTTVSKTTPAISFFGSRQEQSRHKFYTPTPNPKTPFVDIRTWNYWWNSAKPAKNKASLLFFRGSARFNYDRITINATEIVVSSHRPDDNTESVDSLQSKLKEWVTSIDGLSAFLDTEDLDESRWVIQDLSASLRYGKELKFGDFRRFDCLRPIFEVMDHDKLVFKLLRASQSETALSPTEARILSMLKENENTSATDIRDQLDIQMEDAAVLLTSVQEKIGENPDILDQQYSNLPTFKFSANSVVVTYATDLDRVTSYINVLRDVLLNPDDSSLDSICPARMESVEASTAEMVPLAQLEEGGLDFLDELLGDISDVGVVAAQEEVAATPPPQTKKRVAPKGSSTSLAGYFVDQMRAFDSETYDPDDPQILRKCDKPRQPIIMSTAELQNVRPEYDPRTNPAAVLDVENPDGHILCPAYWCTKDRIPLTEAQVTDKKVCPVCGGKVRSTDKAVEKKQDVLEYPVIQRDPSIVFPGYVKYKSKKNDRQIPCCFTTQQTTKIKAPKAETPSTAEAFYVLGESKAKLGPLRLGYIPRIVGKALNIPLHYADSIAAGNRIQAGQSGFYRVGVGHAADTLPSILQLKDTIKPPLSNVDAILRCSFFRTWKGVSEDGDPSIVPAHLKFREKIAGRIEAIDKAFRDKMLSPLEELEYSALALDCQLFVLYVSDTVQIGCFMNVGAVRSVNRAIIVMVENGDPEYVSHVARITTTPQFTGNIYKTQFYPPALLKKMVEMRGKACVSDVPTIDNVVLYVNSTTALKGRMPECKIILDPYGRAQALFLPEVFLLPFKPTAQIPTFFDEKVTGYAEIPDSELPMKGDMLDILKEAIRFHSGFEYAHDLGNREGTVVELILKSGLRVPVRTEGTTTDTTEIVDTVRKQGEGALAWGKESHTTSRAITYEAEVFDFLLYQLSYDIQTGEDNADLRNALSQNTPDLKGLLHEWMEDTLTFTKASDPPLFVKKMRSPCSTGDCSGSLCAWDGASCRVEVKEVRPSLERGKLERRLLSTLTSNEKIRDIVWQHRTSPFFSSVLYLEMPTEVIYSDADISRRLK